MKITILCADVVRNCHDNRPFRRSHTYLICVTPWLISKEKTNFAKAYCFAVLVKHFKILTYFVAVLAAAALSSCSGSCGSREFGLLGTYRTYLSEYFEDGSMQCTARAKVDEQLKPSGLEVAMDLDLIFHFGGALEFQDVRISYVSTVSGDWGVKGDSLFFSPDTSTIQAHFISSNAQNNVEEAMVRQLRRNVVAKLEPQIRAKYSQRSIKSIAIERVGDWGLIGSTADSSAVFLQKTN